MNYDPASISHYFDEFGMLEWDRLTSSPAGEISLALHVHYLKQFIQPGMRVLEIGAGPGRFTQILVELGVHVVVGDISPVQVELNRKMACEKGFEDGVESWHVIDICDLSPISQGSFDAVVAFGGPFSYVVEKRDQALAECWRVLRPEGVLVLSVMSLWGTAHATLENVLTVDPKYNQKITSSGDLIPENYPGRVGRFMHLFRSQEIRRWLEKGDFSIFAMSATGCLSTRWDDKLPEIRTDENKWNELVRMELEACAEPGTLDMGTHLIAVARKVFPAMDLI